MRDNHTEGMAGCKVPRPDERTAQQCYTNAPPASPDQMFIGSEWEKILYAKREQLRFKLREIDDALAVLREPEMQKIQRVLKLINEF